MTPNRDHATLFVVPLPPPDAEAVGSPRSTVDNSAEAMRRLRHPFAVRKGSERSGSLTRRDAAAFSA